MRWICSSAATLVMLVSQSVVPPAPIQSPRDLRQDRGAGVGAIAGRIVDRDTQQPVRWAMVTVVEPSHQFQTSTTTDADGRYRFDNLTPGAYVLRARKAGFVSLAYGARRPRDRGTPIDVGASVSASADILLARGGAIEGRIANQLGDPAQDVAIQAWRVGYDSTGRRLVATGPSTRTDDLGRFRLHSLPPGMYFVDASRFSLPDPDPRGDVQEAAQRSRPFARTYYPGTARADQAQYVMVEKDRTRAIEFSLSGEALNQVSGTVVNSRGETPEMTGVLLRSAGGAPVGGFGLALKRSQFVLANIGAGEYVLVVTTRTTDSDHEFALRPVAMAGRDVIEGVIRTAPGVTLDGIVEMESRDGTSRPASVSIRPQHSLSRHDR